MLRILRWSCTKLLFDTYSLPLNLDYSQYPCVDDEMATVRAEAIPDSGERDERRQRGVVWPTGAAGHGQGPGPGHAYINAAAPSSSRGGALIPSNLYVPQVVVGAWPRRVASTCG